MHLFKEAHDILKGLGQSGVYIKNTLEIAFIDGFVKLRNNEKVIEVCKIAL